ISLITFLIVCVIFSVLFSLVSTSLLETIRSIKVPDDYVQRDLNPEEPEFILSFSITNRGSADILDFYINISEVVIFVDKNSKNPKETVIFSHLVRFGQIPPGKSFKGIFSIGYSEFFIENLNNFWNTMDKTLGYFEELNINLGGKYFLGLVPFKLSIDSYCISCLG
ncbi:MAG: hypothetical protein ACFFE4_13340, partial [Candidatus Thorarchaeota archaeon]